MQAHAMMPIFTGAGGLVLGYLIGYILLRKSSALWQSRVDELKEKLTATKKETSSQVDAEKGKTAQAEKKLQEFKDRCDTVEKSLESEKRQIAQLETALSEAEAQVGKQSAQAEAHLNARVQAEGRCKQAEAMASQAQRSLGQVEESLRSTIQELESLRETSDRRAKEVERLRSAAAATRDSSGTEDSSMQVFADGDGTLEGVLKILLQNEGQQAAVLADANGIIVAGIGETELKERMAAATRLIGNMSVQLADLVPFTTMRSYVLQDTDSNTVAGRSFNCAGETIGLTTFGSHPPAERMLDGAMANLSTILE